MMDMRYFAKKAMDIFRKATPDALDSDSDTHFALRYLVLTVGEAANRVRSDSRDAFPEIPWSDIIRLRNQIAHGYDVMDRDRLHDTVAVELPALVRQLDTILGEE